MPELSFAEFRTPYDDLAEDTELFELVAVPLATEPRVFNAPGFELASDAVEQLEAAGFDKTQANGLAIVFSSKPANCNEAVSAPGFWAGDDYLTKHDDGTFVQYPLSVRVPAGLSPEDSNRIIWQQLGQHLFSLDEERKLQEQQAPEEDALAALLRGVIDAELMLQAFEENQLRFEAFALQNWYAQLVVDKNS